MAKIKTTFFCQNCGAQSPKWVGKCPACGEWNTYVEEVIQKEESGKGSWKTPTTGTKKASVPKKIQEVNYEEQPRYVTGDAELDRVLGGGIVPGSLVLIGGEPGIGKSTLMLQIALILNTKKILYVSVAFRVVCRSRCVRIVCLQKTRNATCFRKQIPNRFFSKSKR